ncbi:MAG: phage holin family protein [Prevotella sp.]|nr:phage holin family protein [Prevotella sp.]MBO7110052.1 phage holin family protein [Prevotella sp.]
MLSSDKNVETIAQLIEALKHYLGLQTEYVKLDVIDKVVRLLTRATLAILLFLILIVVLLFASLGLAFWLSKHIGLTSAFMAVAAMHAFVLLLIYAFRRPWIERPLVRYLARLLLKD